MPQQVGKFDFSGIPAAGQAPPAAPTAPPPAAPDFTGQAPAEQPGGLSRALSGLLQYVLPSTTPGDYIEGPLYAAQHPIDAISLLLNAVKDAHVTQGQKAIQAGREGRYSEMLGHGAATVLPLVGPAAANIGEELGATGDWQTALGQTTGLLSPGLLKHAPGVPAAVKAPVADALARGAENRMTAVISPKTGANKTRFGNQAREVAPALARDPELGALTRDTLAAKVSARLDEARTALDEAADARNSTKAIPTGPILKQLQDARQKLVAEAVEGSEATGGAAQGQLVSNTGAVSDMVPPGRRAPLGKDVIPEEFQPAVAKIDRMIEEVSQLGSIARYEALRRLRAAWDEGAKAEYAPSISADYLKQRSGGKASAEGAGIMRETLAGEDPATAAANAQFHLYKTADSVLRAAKETDQVRPNTFKRTMARTAGAATGAGAGGGLGAIVGVVIGDTMAAIAESGLTTKIHTARLMTTLEDALRGGRTAQAQALIAKLKRIAQTTERSATTAGRYRQEPQD